MRERGYMKFAFCEQENFGDNDYLDILNGIKKEVWNYAQNDTVAFLFCGYGLLEFIAHDAVSQLREEGLSITTIGIVSNFSSKECIDSLVSMDRIIEVPIFSSIHNETDEILQRKKFIVTQTDVLLTVVSSYNPIVIEQIELARNLNKIVVNLDNRKNFL